MRPALLASVALAAAGLTGCGGDDAVGDTRAQQVRRAARDAGLAEEVADVLALAARGTDATFQVTYPGDDGAALRVSQAPPNLRIDVITADHVVESQVVRGRVAYRCQRPEGDLGGRLDCTRTAGALPEAGAFSEEALAAFADDLAGSRDRVELAVERRPIAGVEATCLVATPRADPGGAETLCLSPEGAHLLLERRGERLEAASYRSDVPDGTFDL